MLKSIKLDTKNGGDEEDGEGEEEKDVHKLTRRFVDKGFSKNIIVSS